MHDDGRIVWDEFAGQSITFLPVLYLGQMNWLWLLIGFALFRLFDVWKPWPIGSLTAKSAVVLASCWMILLPVSGRHCVSGCIFISPWLKPFLGLQHVNDCYYSGCR